MSFWHYYPPPWQRRSQLQLCPLPHFVLQRATEDNSAREPRRTYYVCSSLISCGNYGVERAEWRAEGMRSMTDHHHNCCRNGNSQTNKNLINKLINFFQSLNLCLQQKRRLRSMNVN